MEGNRLPVLMLDFAYGEGRVLLVYDVPVVVCVFGLQCDAVTAGAYDMKVSAVDVFQFVSGKHWVRFLSIVRNNILQIVYDKIQDRCI